MSDLLHSHLRGWSAYGHGPDMEKGWEGKWKGEQFFEKTLPESHLFKD